MYCDILLPFVLGRLHEQALGLAAALLRALETVARASGLADACIYLVATEPVDAVAAHFLEYPVVTDRQAVLELFPTQMRLGDGDGTCAGCLSVGLGKP